LPATSSLAGMRSVRIIRAAATLVLSMVAMDTVALAEVKSLPLLAEATSLAFDPECRRLKHSEDYWCSLTGECLSVGVQ
jgi:hypothetical protein